MNTESIIEKTCTCRIRIIAGEWFLIPIHDSSIEVDNLFKISETGTHIWRLIEENNEVKISDIIDSIEEVYDIQREIIDRDVVEFISELKNMNLVKELNDD